MQKKVLIVSPDVSGPVHNGGVGTAIQLLAELLAKSKYKVTLLFAVSRSDATTIDWPKWVKYYREKRVELTKVELDRHDFLVSDWAASSFRVYQQIKSLDSDLVIFPDMFGLAYATLQAKILGLAFQSTPILTLFLGPQAWSRPETGRLFSGVYDFHFSTFERESLAASDWVQFATKGSREWCEKNNWTYKSQSTLLFPLPGRRRAKTYSISEADELVFFGRLEKRKGLREFLDSVTNLDRQGHLNYKRITFLGKDHDFEGERATTAIQRWKAALISKIQVRVETTFDSTEAVNYLRSRKAIAAVLSHSETMGYTFAECLIHGIPVIASSIEPFAVLAGRTHQKDLVKISDPRQLEVAIRDRLAFRDSSRGRELKHKTDAAWLKLIKRLASGRTSFRTDSSELKRELRPRLSVIHTDVRDLHATIRNFTGTHAIFLDSAASISDGGRKLLSDTIQVSRADVLLLPTRELVSGQEHVWRDRIRLPLSFNPALEAAEGSWQGAGLVVSKAFLARQLRLKSRIATIGDLHASVLNDTRLLRRFVFPEAVVDRYVENEDEGKRAPRGTVDYAQRILGDRDLGEILVGMRSRFDRNGQQAVAWGANGASNRIDQPRELRSFKGRRLRYQLLLDAKSLRFPTTPFGSVRRVELAEGRLVFCWTDQTERVVEPTFDRYLSLEVVLLKGSRIRCSNRHFNADLPAGLQTVRIPIGNSIKEFWIEFLGSDVLFLKSASIEGWSR